MPTTMLQGVNFFGNGARPNSLGRNISENNINNSKNAYVEV